MAHEARVPLLPVPAGFGNIFARAFGLRPTVAAVTETLERGCVKLVQVDVDGRRIADRTPSAIVANVPTYRTFMPLIPDASPFDGLLDVFVAPEMSKSGLGAWLWDFSCARRCSGGPPCAAGLTATGRTCCCLLEPRRVLELLRDLLSGNGIWKSVADLPNSVRSHQRRHPAASQNSPSSCDPRPEAPESQE